MREAANIYDGLTVTSATLVEIDLFRLSFSDGTGTVLTLRQVQAIRRIPLTGTPLRILPRPLAELARLP